jgi:hypothetical protein
MAAAAHEVCTAFEVTQRVAGSMVVCGQAAAARMAVGTRLAAAMPGIKMAIAVVGSDRVDEWARHIPPSFVHTTLQEDMARRVLATASALHPVLVYVEAGASVSTAAMLQLLARKEGLRLLLDESIMPVGGTLADVYVYADAASAAAAHGDGAGSRLGPGEALVVTCGNGSGAARYSYLEAAAPPIDFWLGCAAFQRVGRNIPKIPRTACHK